jgi:hypothetical protein
VGNGGFDRFWGFFFFFFFFGLRLTIFLVTIEGLYIYIIQWMRFFLFFFWFLSLVTFSNFL